ncbi:hypothetical protein CDAR_537841 [Caerostris darwini]|uniref:Uncharacterized protein n=1 Tax=Caerostris darwini TaxID=1538125 RepID=A0AAV4PSS8_9ARAC|nr:hypothetical protein CDAR_537841 [Caerostris darwini]
MSLNFESSISCTEKKKRKKYWYPMTGKVHSVEKNKQESFSRVFKVWISATLSPSLSKKGFDSTRVKIVPLFFLARGDSERVSRCCRCPVSSLQNPSACISRRPLPNNGVKNMLSCSC